MDEIVKEYAESNDFTVDTDDSESHDEDHTLGEDIRINMTPEDIESNEFTQMIRQYFAAQETADQSLRSLAEMIRGKAEADRSTSLNEVYEIARTIINEQEQKNTVNSNSKKNISSRTYSKMKIFKRKLSQLVNEGSLVSKIMNYETIVH